ncbi:MAG: AzlC family ABC transporter permease [Candidatus Anaerobiospirillum merdipullorum]|uniref:AzlC family ABC transporter permease n=1 Tax=Candidatus Anaerobiospirillum merdipullorum TaxID=2838450 RepID=A0A9E2NRM3_9GAMM|nr:AzlC family ABC transporter permease [Candidatus Anaerobiospirillum merdipullorum]
MTARQLFLQGMRAGIPVVFGYVPVGIAYGVSALEAGFSPFETILMSCMVYSGSGQVLGVSMTAQHAGLVAIFIATFLINFRYFIMSACIFSRLPGLSNLGRVLASWFVVDETFAIFTTAPNKLAKISYLAGIIALTYSSWVLGAAIGVAAHAVLPAWISAGLGIALYALFIAIVVPGCKRNGRILVMVLCCALSCTLLSMVIDGSWAIVISTLVCAAVGALFIKEEPKAVDDNMTASDNSSASKEGK